MSDLIILVYVYFCLKYYCVNAQESNIKTVFIGWQQELLKYVIKL